MFRFGDPGGRIYGSVGTSYVNLLSHWTGFPAGNNNPSIAVSAGNGRTIGSCLRVGMGNYSTWYLGKTLPDSQATLGIALAIKVTLLASAAITILAFGDSGTTQVDLRVSPNGSLTVTRNGTTLGTTSSATISSNAWTHIELKAKIDPSVGTIGLWVNGVQKLNLTSQNTRATSNSSANQITIGWFDQNSVTGTWNYDVDDIILYDGQTTDANGLADITGPIGDCGLAWLLPTAAGATTQFTPDSGSNYARVNESTVDTISYVESSTTGNIDTYTMADLPGSASAVKSVAAVSFARKTDVGSRQQIAAIRTGGTNYFHPTAIDLLDSYMYNFRNWGSNPNTSAAWTVSDVNGLEAGQKVG